MFGMNPYPRAVRKYFHDMLPEHYTKEMDETIDRVASMITTEQDTQKFATLMGGLYGAGYSQAIKDTKKTLSEHGIKLTLTTKKDLP